MWLHKAYTKIRLCLISIQYPFSFGWGKVIQQSAFNLHSSWFVCKVFLCLPCELFICSTLFNTFPPHFPKRKKSISCLKIAKAIPEGILARARVPVFKEDVLGSKKKLGLASMIWGVPLKMGQSGVCGIPSSAQLLKKPHLHFSPDHLHFLLHNLLLL